MHMWNYINKKGIDIFHILYRKDVYYEIDSSR